jgi:hypothetical protein
MPKPVSTAQDAELQQRMDRQRLLAQQDDLTGAEKAELLELTTILTAVFCTGWPIEERIAAAIGEPVLRALRAKKLVALESATAVFFDFKGSPSGGTQIWIDINEETDLFRVQLLQVHGARGSKHWRRTRIQGKSGVTPLGLSRVVQDLSRHGARR